MIGSGMVPKDALQWGLSAAVTAMMGHLFGIEVVRNGREIGEPKAARPKSGPPSAGTGSDGETSAWRPSKLPVENKPSVRFLVPVALVLLLSVGCSSLLPAVIDVMRGVSDATQILGAIEAAERVWFASHPAADVQAKIDQAIAATHLALATAMRATQGVKDLTDDQWDAAFLDFRQAYAGLQVLLKEAGILHDGGKIAVARGGIEVVIPQPIAMARRHP